MAALDDVQRSVIVGSLLGDGAMRCKRNALLEINHCLAQKFYVDWKYRILRNLVRTAPKARLGNGGRLAYRFTTLSAPELTPYYRAFYPGGKKKIPGITIDPMALAIWFMDDGSKSRQSVYLNTQQFEHSCQERLQFMLWDQLQIRVTFNRDKQYVRLRVATSSLNRFRSFVKPYMMDELSYKLPAERAPQ